VVPQSASSALAKALVASKMRRNRENSNQETMVFVETRGKTMGKPWENHGKNMGNGDVSAKLKHQLADFR